MSNHADYNTKILEVSNLKQHFKVGVGKNKLKVRAVDGINFSVYKKEVFGLVGESGCGKTTTGRTMIRLYRPTSGTVSLDGEVVGSGNGEFIELLKERKKLHAIEMLKLNQYKYDIYLLNQKYDNQKENLLNEINHLKIEYKQKKLESESEILDYKKHLFESKNQLEVDLEKILFDYRLNSVKIINQTKNEYLVEYKQLIKGVELANKKKLQGIKESAALSDESKESYKATIHESYIKKLEDLKLEFLPKIDERSKNLLSKKDSKIELHELKSSYVAAKTKLISDHKLYVANLTKPDFPKIKENDIKIKIQLNKDIRAIEIKIKELSKKKALEKAQINSSKVVDKEELSRIKSEYHAFRKEQKNHIHESRRVHFSKESEKKILKMQMIFQDPISSLNPRMTVQEIVSEGLVINGERNKKVIQQKVIESLKQVGLAPEYISRYPHEFSGGQRQRIGIARALIMDPSVIIADEPISALDVSIKAQVINLLRDLKEELDLTILFIAHDLSVVKFFCDRIAVMYFGKIVELASSEELFANPLHGYTQSLLSAIPHPDPDFEKTRKRFAYSPRMHDYSEDKPEFVEITKGHFISANKKELIEMKKKLGVTDEN
ncbi:MAG: ABC transporter ATP-binding protein [Acholeplasmataceae bacterium]|nr:ABC transporter ATP-binding protein [Acholeplasmataceae bacterium]